MLVRYLNILSPILLGISAVLIAYSIYLVFLVVPNEAIMGPVQRIFYFHVGSAIAAYCAIAVLLVCSLAYLARREEAFDAIAEAAAEVALLMCTIVLVSGMIWANSAWNTWFRWEPRLVTFLLLWLLLLAYWGLRQFGDPARVAAHCAVLGILGAINVPIVVYSIKLLPHMVQLHPEVVERQGLKDPLFKTAMFWSMGAMVAFQMFLTVFRTRIGLLERELLRRKSRL
ncbi:MAG: cytochrome c biogenesis protein CcsA [Deltaproteobacteria bacterium]|nr:cytochrome c biogenesis protein CcsA [Deltaproteobacteria bacterium]